MVDGKAQKEEKKGLSWVQVGRMAEDQVLASTTAGHLRTGISDSGGGDLSPVRFTRREEA